MEIAGPVDRPGGRGKVAAQCRRLPQGEQEENGAARPGRPERGATGCGAESEEPGREQPQAGGGREPGQGLQPAAEAEPAVGRSEAAQQPASQLLAELYEELGPHEYDRVDVTLREEERDAIAEQAAAATPSEIAGLRVVSRDTLDGYRFTLEGGWWLLLRFSGTEPLLRIYAEMPSAAQVRQAIAHGQALAGVTL